MKGLSEVDLYFVHYQNLSIVKGMSIARNASQQLFSREMERLRQIVGKITLHAVIQRE